MHNLSQNSKVPRFSTLQSNFLNFVKIVHLRVVLTYRSLKLRKLFVYREPQRRCLFTITRPKQCRSAMLDPKDRAFCFVSGSLFNKKPSNAKCINSSIHTYTTKLVILNCKFQLSTLNPFLMQRVSEMFLEV